MVGGNPRLDLWHSRMGVYVVLSDRNFPSQAEGSHVHANLRLPRRHIQAMIQHQTYTAVVAVLCASMLVYVTSTRGSTAYSFALSRALAG